MKRLKSILAAEAEDNKLDDAIDVLKDDFDFILSGLEKLGRSGAESSNNALIIAEQLEESLQEIIGNISENLLD